jgi:hypothetical protein
VKIVIQDASVLIDMADGDLLDAWFGLGFDLRTTSLVWREVNRKNIPAGLATPTRRWSPTL